MINPAMAGTGIKIKTLEALSYLRPIVTWPNGVDGVTPEVAALCRTVEDWPGFAQEVADILASTQASGFSDTARATLERESRLGPRLRGARSHAGRFLRIRASRSSGPLNDHRIAISVRELIEPASGARCTARPATSFPIGAIHPGRQPCHIDERTAELRANESRAYAR